MKLSYLKSFALFCSLSLLFVQCGKRQPNMVAVPDTELQSTLEATFALQNMTDIEMICSFLGENNSAPKFYLNSPASNVSATSGTFTSRNDNINKSLLATFAQTKCFDGKLRDGTITMDYSNINPDINYYHDFGFVGKGNLAEYKVDGWLIKTTAGSQFIVTNKLISNSYNPAITRLSWSIEGSFEFTHPSDPSKNMTWSGKLVKTLINSTDPQVFPRTVGSLIDWTKAIVEYQGEINGTTSNATPYKLSISPTQPLTRDFTCTPYKVGGVDLTPNLRAWNEEYHPFTSGVATFVKGTAYPRLVNYGNEGTTNLDQQCDNSGTVLIKGILYKVDFIK
jgi:hypothetical protein